MARHLLNNDNLADDENYILFNQSWRQNAPKNFVQ